ncbi:Glycoside hydrolase family 3 C-terminal domain-containing protein [Hirschfeldia incana]|nr:Glycoside hydrolase family 3 C-terminal domain-containing protein [Hirschfeldia incana]
MTEVAGDITAMDCVYKNPNEAVEDRIQDLLQRMTVEEKIGQMTQIHRGVTSDAVIKDFFIGSVCNSAGKSGNDVMSEDWAKMIDGFQTAALETRLAIPIIYGLDAVHGNNKFYGTTIFPHNIGLGATRDYDLARRIGSATALEVRASGAHWVFAPCVAVCKDPRWGRCLESYSEDTEVVCNMTSIVSGLQGTPPEGHSAGYPFLAGRNNVVACAKHFVGDGGTEMGKNEGDTISSYEDLERIHMAPYLNCLAQGVSAVMPSYSRWNGSQLHGDRFLLTEILKDKLGFKGCLVSDWSGIDKMGQPRGSNYRGCVEAAINAGIDMVMVPYTYEKFINELTSLVKEGKILMSRIDDAVERILRLKYTAGVFEHPFSDSSLLKFVGCKEHREIAREAVRKSLVLLKNGKDSEKPFLPLDRNAKRVLVAGTHADDLGFQCGGWSKTWQGQSGRITIGTTALDAVKATVGAETEVVYEKTPSEETLSNKDFSYAIVVVGEAPYAESRGDDPEPSIHFDGAEVVRLVAEKIPTVAILVTGRPVILDTIMLEKVEALVAAWLPGTEGDGVADVVFGDYDFTGKLPMSWFRATEQLPMNLEADGYDPLFPLGFGLKFKKG